MSRLDSILHAVSRCAPGQAVAVSFAGFKAELPAKPATPPAPPPPHPAEVAVGRLLEREAASRQAAAMHEAEVKASLERVNALLERTVAGQEKIVDTLLLPVVPTSYDKGGRITSAQRKKKE